jgi:hypothetical protein
MFHKTIYEINLLKYNIVVFSIVKDFNLMLNNFSFFLHYKLVN